MEKTGSVSSWATDAPAEERISEWTRTREQPEKKKKLMDGTQSRRYRELNKTLKTIYDDEEVDYGEDIFDAEELERRTKNNTFVKKCRTLLPRRHECEAAIQSICDASVDEDYQYHGSIPQYLGFREDAQTRMQSSQPHHPYNSRRPSSDENSVIGGTHQPTHFMIEKTQVQQQNELLNTRVREVPMEQELESVMQEQ